MPAEDDSLQQLRAALDRLTDQDATEIVEQARIQAREQVRSILTEAFTDSILRRVHAQLEPAEEPGPPPPSEPPEPPEPPTPPRPPGRSRESAWYVYGVIGAGDGTAAQRVSPQATVVREGELAAVVSEVPIEDFGEEQLRTHLADMRWVERTARVHEEVLDALARTATVVPMRMCSVYGTEDGVREMLRHESGALEQALDHLRGRSEWGVKVFADPARARASVASTAQEPETGTSGTAYMERRRNEREEAERAAQLVERAAAEIHEALCSLAADGLVVPSQRPEVSGHTGEMVLNGVYLVEDSAQEAFHERIAELAAEHAGAGLELDPTGPWPAYNFVPGAIGAAW